MIIAGDIRFDKQDSVSPVHGPGVIVLPGRTQLVAMPMGLSLRANSHRRTRTT
jgi:hypothetical protein